MMTEFDDEDSYDDEQESYAIRPNKTLIKKEIAVMFALGEAISKLPLAKLSDFNLPENIKKAITEVANMPHTGARKRSLKYIASQFHKMDVTEIQEKLARIQSKSVHATREHHLTEHWRDKLILDGNAALSELIEHQPTADLQQIRQLLRNIKKETETEKPPKSTRLLYRYLKTLFETDTAQS